MTGEWIVQSLMTIAILSRGDAWSARCAIGCRRPSGPTTFGGCVGVRVSVLDSVVWLLASEVIVGFRSEEHTSELQSLMRISYAVFCLKKKTQHHHSSYMTLTTH